MPSNSGSARRPNLMHPLPNARGSACRSATLLASFAPLCNLPTTADRRCDQGPRTFCSLTRRGRAGLDLSVRFADSYVESYGGASTAVNRNANN